MAVPTRAYIAPEELRRMHLKPTTLRRKVIEISPELIALWSGDYFAARVFAQRATDWFRDAPVNKEALVWFLEAHYRQPVPNFSAIIVPGNNANWFLHYWRIDGKTAPSTLTLKGDSIEKFFNLRGDGRRISFEPKDIYYTSLFEKATEIRNSLHSN